MSEAVAQQEEWRTKFEERAYGQRFLHSIRKVQTGTPFVLQSIGCPTKAEFIKRDEKGGYLDPTLDAMWWAWREALKLTKQQGEDE